MILYVTFWTFYKWEHHKIFILYVSHNETEHGVMPLSMDMFIQQGVQGSG